MIFNYASAEKRVTYDLPSIVIFCALFFVDFLLYDFGRSALLRAAICFSVLFAGCATVTLAVIHFRKSNVPPAIKGLIILFTSIVLFWMIHWIVCGTTASMQRVIVNKYISIFANPFVSIFAYLLVCLIPLVSYRLKNRCIFPPAKTTLYVTLILFIVSSAMIYFTDFSNNKPLNILIIFCVLSCSKDDLKWYSAILILLFCVYTQIVVDNRSYAIASMFAIFIYPFKTVGRWQGSLLFFITALSLAIYVVGGRIIMQYISSIIEVRSFAADSRTFLVYELFGQLSGAELLHGRGLDGVVFSRMMYYQTVIYNNINADFPFRINLEVGTLNMVLKMGLSGLLMFMTIIAYPIIMKKCKKKSDSFTDTDLMANSCLKMILIYTLLYSSELPQTINFSYGLWYACIGVSFYYFYSKRIAKSPFENSRMSDPTDE